MSAVQAEYLAKLNPHPRDQYVVFEEGPHLYYRNGIQVGISCTSFVKEFFPAFNATEAVNNIINSGQCECDPTYKYYGMSRSEILKFWEKNRDEAAIAGTFMHLQIELSYNKEPYAKFSPELLLFNNYVREYPKKLGWEPYRTEWVVFTDDPHSKDVDLDLAGSIDMVYLDTKATKEAKKRGDDRDHLVLVDWKRCKNPLFENSFRKKCSKPFDHLEGVDGIKYSLQLNTYKYMLEQYYDKVITGMYLVVLHPDQKDHLTYKVGDYSKEINFLVERRKAFLKGLDMDSIRTKWEEERNFRKKEYEKKVKEVVEYASFDLPSMFDMESKDEKEEECKEKDVDEPCCIQKDDVITDSFDLGMFNEDKEKGVDIQLDGEFKYCGLLGQDDL